MRINPYNIPNLGKVYQEQNAKDRVEKRKGADDASSVQLSDKALAIEKYRARMKELSEVREKLVKEIREKIEAGTYRADAEAIAKGIIEEARLDRRV
ncbi:MAG: flagellar biosynthesis anti-sigma factor FlgM [Peptococcaceae bacterium]|nr:flagellar biosynthesis anti-sigma factor FlgM [Peptococcaceae bacterium]